MTAFFRRVLVEEVKVIWEIGRWYKDQRNRGLGIGNITAINKAIARQVILWLGKILLAQSY